MRTWRRPRSAGMLCWSSGSPATWWTTPFGTTSLWRGWVRVLTGAAGGVATLRVTNSGPVVPADEVERLLQPFQRAGPKSASAARSLGLGLSIVAAIAASHDAELAVTPVPGGGLSTPGSSSRHQELADLSSGPTRSWPRSCSRRWRECRGAGTAHRPGLPPGTVARTLIDPDGGGVVHGRCWPGRGNS